MRLLQSLGPLAVSGLLLAALALLFDPSEVVAQLSTLSPADVGLSCLALIACFAIGAARFARAAGRASGHAVSAREVALRVVPLSLFTILLAHGLSLGSEAVRVHYLMRRSTLGLGAATFVALADRAIGLASSAILAAFGVVMFPGMPGPVRAVALGLAVAGMAAMLLVARHPGLLTRFSISRERIGLFLRDPADVSFQLVVAAASSAAFGAAIYVLAAAIGAHLPFFVCLLAAPVISTGISIPFTFVGWGVREAVHVLVFSTTGLLAPDVALAISLALGACIFAASLPGMIWLGTTGKTVRGQRKVKNSCEGVRQ